MADDEKLLRAHCFCKNFSIDVPVRASSLPLSAEFCHCTRCRRASGALATSYVKLEQEGFVPESSTLRRLEGYKSSEKVTRYFCPTCGCHVLWNGPGETRWFIATGCLEKVDGMIQFTKHIFIEDTVDGGCSDWIVEHNDKPISRCATFTDELELGWRKSGKSTVPQSSAQLHAHCDCGGVNIYIARPPASSKQATTFGSDTVVPHDSGSPNRHENETWWLRADKQKFLGGVCVCDSCRLVNGFEFIEWAFIPTRDIFQDPEGKMPFSREFGSLKAFRSSDRATRRFCGRCGATVFWDGDERPGLIDVAVGLLDASEGSRAESWLEWKTDETSFREDGEPRAKGLVDPAAKALHAWGKKVQGREGPCQKFLDANNGKII